MGQSLIVVHKEVDHSFFVSVLEVLFSHMHDTLFVLLLKYDCVDALLKGIDQILSFLLVLVGFFLFLNQFSLEFI